MCGFVGVVGEIDETTLVRVTQSLAHRGPDGEGFWSDEQANVHLGFRRLAILDKAGGAQPMSTSDGSIALVFNGEIYNHRKLRRELEADGGVFTSDHADGEVILQGYALRGSDIVDDLEGMFAFAIADLNRQELFLARDRFGEKPLFYSQVGRRLAFASEARALGLLDESGLGVDPDQVARFFAYGHVPAPGSLWLGIRKLEPGHTLTFGLHGERREKHRRYWQFRTLSRPGAAADPERLTELLENAVRARLEADVPLGFLLSGGLDSSAIALLARRADESKSIRTFTAGFDEATFDERRYARVIAGMCDSQHHEVVVRRGDALDAMGALYRRMDEPISDPSFLPTALLCEDVRSNVTVALSGDGGDELFAGYDPFKALAAAKVYRAVMPAAAHRIMLSLMEGVQPGDTNMNFSLKVRQGIRGAGSKPGLWNPLWMAPASLAEIQMVTGGRSVRAEEVFDDALDHWNSCESDNLVDRTTEFFGRFYLQLLLTKVDRASMLHGLEVRSPFLDTALAEFALSLPARQKFRRGKGKRILRDALVGVVPAEILDRPKKGFGIPVSAWLREFPPPDRGLAADAGLDGKALTGMWEQHRTGASDHRGVLWSWYALQESLRGAKAGAE